MYTARPPVSSRRTVAVGRPGQLRVREGFLGVARPVL
jgi:hypothetical protein